MKYELLPMSLELISTIHSKGNNLYCFALAKDLKSDMYPVLIGFSSNQPKDDKVYKLLLSSTVSTNKQRFYKNMRKFGAKKLSHKTFLANKEIIYNALKASIS